MRALQPDDSDNTGLEGASLGLTVHVASHPSCGLVVSSLSHVSTVGPDDWCRDGLKEALLRHGHCVGVLAVTIANHSETYDALIIYANQEIRSGQLDRAEVLARHALSLDPMRAASYNVLALVSEIGGSQSEAMDLLRAGLAVEPTYRPARENLGRLGRYPLMSSATLEGGEKFTVSARLDLSSLQETAKGRR